jgi:plastocyanin domain-containing protein
VLNACKKGRRMINLGFDKTIVTLVGIAAIGCTYWFFLLKKRHEVPVADVVTIVVDGGYTPEVIAITQNKPTTLNFMRKDPSSCLEEVILSDFKVRKHLPLNKTVAVTITPAKTGEFTYSCGMNMYHGKIIVR